MSCLRAEVSALPRSCSKHLSRAVAGVAATSASTVEQANPELTAIAKSNAAEFFMRFIGFPFLSDWSDPILNSQAGYAVELAAVIGDDNEALGAGVPGNHLVIGAYLLAKAS